MLKKLRIGQIMDSLWLIVILGVLSGVMLWNVGLSSITALMGPKPLAVDAELSDMVGKYISLEVKYPVDEYMETTKTTKVNGVSTGTKKDRSSWLVLDEDRGICISIEVPNKRYDEILDQSDAFWDAYETGADLPTSGVTVSGTLEILEGEDLSYFESALEYYMGTYSEPVVYHVSHGRIHGETLVNIYGLTAIGSVLLLFALFILVKTLKNSAKKLTNEYLAANPGVTMEDLENDFASAQEQAKVFIGRKWTFCAKLEKLILDNSQIIWVHTGSMRSGRSVNFYVWWEMLDGSTQQVSLSSEKKCTTVMNAYGQFPHILTGNSAEYSYLLQNDREALLNMKYRSQSMEG
ncbi:hypothetical protein D5278_09865 [bacterium 1XD21-13]|nr:hypothetical protein [bacterium 1XD21-13]